MVYHALSTLNLINSESPTDPQLLMGMRFLSLSLFMLKSTFIFLLAVIYLHFCWLSLVSGVLFVLWLDLVLFINVNLQSSFFFSFLFASEVCRLISLPIQTFYM